MNIATAENSIVTLLAQTLQLTENVNLFRLARPAGVYCGFTVELFSGTPATADSVNEFSASITGADFDRNTLWNTFALLFLQLKNGENHGDFLWLKLEDPVAFSRETVGGLLLYTGKTTLRFSFI